MAEEFPMMLPWHFKKPARSIRRVFLHCTASDADIKCPQLAHKVKEWHLARKFSTVGYHFVIDKQGWIQKGRDIEQTPAAQAGHNLATIAICVHGLKKEKFTSEQLHALKMLVAEINRQYNGKVTFHGHKEVAAKDCPVIDYKKLLQLDAKGYTSIGVMK